MARAAVALVVSSATVAAQSTGCGLPPPVRLGQTELQTVSVEGQKATYLLHLPASYDASRPTPLILSHGGWGVGARRDSTESGLANASDAYGFAVAFIEGFSDDPNSGSWSSFNTVGSVGSTPDAPTCLAWSGSTQYCYSSCAARPQGCDARGCDWTTCLNSTAVSEAVLDDLEARMCVDVAREYATGQSNGAIFTLRLAVQLSHRLAAVAAISGTFAQGFVDAPTAPVPVIACSGIRDNVVPVNATNGTQAVSSEGWVYAPLDDVYEIWSVANGCEQSTAAHWRTKLDGVKDLYCWGSFVDCAPVVRCAWKGAHQYFAHRPLRNGQFVWDFVSQFAKQTHLGRGRSSGPPETQRLTYQAPAFLVEDDNDDGDDEFSKEEEEGHQDTPVVDQGLNYGDPARGCARNEYIVDFSDWRSLRACAPRLSTPCSSAVCPRRLDVPQAEPICLSASGAGYHCALACNLAAPTCPRGSRCVAGHLLHAQRGICLYRARAP